MEKPLCLLKILLRNAVKQKGHSIKYIDDPDNDVQLAAVYRNGYSIAHIKNPSKIIQIIAVKDEPSSIRYIDNPLKEVVLRAVMYDWKSIEYVKEPYKNDIEVQLAALKENINAMAFIDELQPEAIAYVRDRCKASIFPEYFEYDEDDYCDDDDECDDDEFNIIKSEEEN